MQKTILTIGPAPDFVLAEGKVIFHHKLVIEVTQKDGKPMTLNFTNPSLHQFIKETKRRLDYFVPDAQKPLEWRTAEHFSAEIETVTSKVVIRYVLPSQLPLVERKRLCLIFAKAF